jgi:hypothetical protein
VPIAGWADKDILKVAVARPKVAVKRLSDGDLASGGHPETIQPECDGVSIRLEPQKRQDRCTIKNFPNNRSGTSPAAFVVASTMTEIELLQKQLAAAQAEIAELRIRLSNAEMMYKFEVGKAKDKDSGGTPAESS